MYEANLIFERMWNPDEDEELAALVVDYCGKYGEKRKKPDSWDIWVLSRWLRKDGEEEWRKGYIGWHPWAPSYIRYYVH